MKKILFYVLLITLVSVPEISAQTSSRFDNSLWLVFTSSNVDETKLEKARDLMEKYFAPILDEMLLQGKLLSWGYFKPDESGDANFNLYFVNNDQSDFDLFWGGYTSRAAEEYPEEWAELNSTLKSSKVVSHTNTLAHFTVPQR